MKRAQSSEELWWPREPPECEEARRGHRSEERRGREVMGGFTENKDNEGAAGLSAKGREEEGIKLPKHIPPRYSPGVSVRLRYFEEKFPAKGNQEMKRKNERNSNECKNRSRGVQYCARRSLERKQHVGYFLRHKS